MRVVHVDILWTHQIVSGLFSPYSPPQSGDQANHAQLNVDCFAIFTQWAPLIIVKAWQRPKKCSSHIDLYAQAYLKDLIVILYALFMLWTFISWIMSLFYTIAFILGKTVFWVMIYWDNVFLNKLPQTIKKQSRHNNMHRIIFSSSVSLNWLHFWRTYTLDRTDIVSLK